MIYFTSDLHLGHANAIKLCRRPFSCVEEMDETLIANWNERVTNGDTVYILGDLLFRNHTPTESYLDRLKGKKHLITGNHDRKWMKQVPLDKFFLSVNPMLHFSDGKHNITACHYPMMSWPCSGKGSYMVFGHIHGNTDADYWPLIERSELMLNAGVDVNDFRPVTFGEMEENNLKHKAHSAAMRIIDKNRDLFESIAKMQKQFPKLLEDDIDGE